MALHVPASETGPASATSGRTREPIRNIDWILMLAPSASPPWVLSSTRRPAPASRFDPYTYSPAR